jgi:hypothetical protein
VLEAAQEQQVLLAVVAVVAEVVHLHLYQETLVVQELMVVAVVAVALQALLMLQLLVVLVVLAQQIAVVVAVAVALEINKPQVQQLHVARALMAVVVLLLFTFKEK